MNLDMDRINEIFGQGMISEIRDNKEDFIENIKFAQSIGYKDVYELVEHYPYTFLEDPIIFKEKVEKLLNSLGVESFEKIEDNIDIWGSLDE